MHRVRNQT
jgi:hypothetical protein